ncbi:hypothetical protein [Streptomyces xantholiticus]|uniref:hypothetical protein n=1 Tax=Streptomyces xantholiticus TaxID=68285 RepID=UPI0019A7EFE3|nr:hypothetical protein [Streptomyces xantholiticus]GGW62239.1 hypothetical protein GCM10010381_54180 [Streptomyces xantholiticus]
MLGVFVPSGGSKWVAPYVLDAANQRLLKQGWMVVAYDLGEVGTGSACSMAAGLAESSATAASKSRTPPSSASNTTSA